MNSLLSEPSGKPFKRFLVVLTSVILGIRTLDYFYLDELLLLTLLFFVSAHLFCEMKVMLWHFIDLNFLHFSHFVFLEKNC